MVRLSCDRVVVALALCLAAVAWHQSCDARDTRAALLALTQRADSVAQAAQDSAAVYAARQRADSLALAARDREVARVRAAYARATGQTDSVLHDTTVVLDSAQVIGLRIAIAAERNAARELLRQQDSVIATLRRGLAWRDDALAAKDTQLALQQRLLREALAAKRPSNFWRGVAVGASVVGLVAALR